jgi:hypothetical protein
MDIKSEFRNLFKRLIPAFLVSWCFCLTLNLIFVVHEFISTKNGPDDYWTSFSNYLNNYPHKNIVMMWLIVIPLLGNTLNALILTPAAAWALRIPKKNLLVCGSVLWFLLLALILLPLPIDETTVYYLYIILNFIGFTAIGFLSFKLNDPPAAPVPPTPPASPTRRVIAILLASFFGLALYEGGIYLFHLYQKKQYQKDDFVRKTREQLDNQIKMSQVIRPQIEDIRLNGSSLPPCPLIYPLLNEKGKITPLGSFISLCAMRQATFLPQAVFKLEKISGSFADFHLFTMGDPAHNPYREQLPYYYGPKNFAEGTLKKTAEGFKINLRFWGARPAKKYQKNFKTRNLNLAPGWIAVCLDNYTGFKPTPAQTRIMAHPTFIQGGDLIKASGYESYFWNGGTKLVLHWDKFLSANPEDPYLFDRKLVILHAIDYGNYLGAVEPMLLKNPNNTYLQTIAADEYNTAQKYDLALKLGLAELKTDDNNASLYDSVTTSLTWKGDWIDTYQLLKNWTQKYPDNVTAWLRLGEFMKDWAWNARGDGLADTVPKEAWPIFQKRIAEGYGYVQKAVQMAPQSWLPWSYALSYGTGADLDDDTMENYFQKARTLDPYCYGTYSNYLDYLKPKWTGSQENMENFATLYATDFPYLMVEVAIEDMVWDPKILHQKQLSPSTKEAYNNSHSWPVFEKYIRLYLNQFPYDLGTWYVYLQYAELAGKLDEVYQLGQKKADENPELKALPLQLILTHQDSHYWVLDTNQDKSAYWNSQDRFKEVANVALKMEKLDPENWYWPNKALCFQIHTSQVAAAVKSYKFIGEKHWDPTICEQSDWDTAKKWAITPPATTPAPSLPHRQ